MGAGQTLLVLTWRRIVSRAERIVCTWTHSLENEYGSAASSGWASTQASASAQSSIPSSSVMASSRSGQRPPAIDAVLTIAPPGGTRSEQIGGQPAQRQQVHRHHRRRRQRAGDPRVVEQHINGAVDPPREGGNGGRVAQIGRQEHGGRTTIRLVPVHDDDRGRPQLGQHLHQRGAHPRRAPRHHHPLAVVTIRIGHGSTPYRELRPARRGACA